MSVMMRKKHSLSFVLSIALLIPQTLEADVNVQPHFGHPFIFSNRIVFASVDGTHLIGVDKQGNRRWELNFRGRVVEQRWKSDSMLVQSGRQVFQIDVERGTKSDLVTMPQFQLLEVDPDDSFVFAVDSRFDHRSMKILDPLRYTTTWESSAIESITRVTPTTIVAITADREIEKHSGYRLKNAALRGYDRANGQVRWSLPLANSQAGEVISAFSEDHLVIIDGFHSPRLLVLNPETGAILSIQSGNFLNLWISGDTLTLLENGAHPGEAVLYDCKLPQCADKSAKVAVSAKEILTFRVYRDYVITAGIYDSACFLRSGGKRLWQKGQLEWSEPFDDEMVATDFSSKDQAARLFSINLQTGEERVLFVRKVTEKDRKAFGTW